MLILILISIVVFIFLVLIIYRDPFHDFFSPQILITLFFILFYIFPSFQFVQGDDYFTKTVGIFFAGVSPTEIDRINTIIVAFISFVCLIWGIYFSFWIKVSRVFHKTSVKSEIFWNKFNYYNIIFLYVIVGVLETLLFVGISGGALSIILNLENKFQIMSGKYIFTFGYMFLSIASLLILLHDKKITFSFVLLLLTSILSASLLINRGIIFIILGLILLSYNYYIKQLSTKRVFLLSILGLFGAVFYKVLQVFIITNWNFKYLLSEYFFLAIARDLFGDVLIGPQQLSFALKGIPSILGFQYGKTIIGFLISLIPTTFFINKPMFSGAGIYTQELFPAIFHSGTTIPPGLVGELYMNFSIFGVVLGMFICGLFLGSVFYDMKLKKSAFLIVFYSFSIISFLYLLRGEFLLLNKYLIFLFLFWIALRFSSRERIVFLKRSITRNENND
jgi:oligosaccharide repeat unit polymerase